MTSSAMADQMDQEQASGKGKAKGPVSDRSKNTLFVRNLPFTATTPVRDGGSGMRAHA